MGQMESLDLLDLMDLRETEAHHPRDIDVTVQCDHRDIIYWTDSGPRSLPVARVDLEMLT